MSKRMDGLIYFCYQYVLCKDGKLETAIVNEIDIAGEDNIWIGVGGEHIYPLTTKEVNAFLNKYLIKEKIKCLIK